MKLTHPITWQESAGIDHGLVETFPKFRFSIQTSNGKLSTVPIGYVEVDVDQDVAEWLEKTHNRWTQTASLMYTILRYRYIIPNELYVIMALKWS
jgi:hypothetical protein